MLKVTLLTAIVVAAIAVVAIADPCDTLWTRTYGGSSSDYGRSVSQTTDGGYIIAGETWSFGAGQSDVYLVKTDASGDTLWTRTYGATYSDVGYSVQQTSDGGYIICGYTEYHSGEKDVLLIKTNANGTPLLSRNYGGNSDDWGYSVQQTDDGGYIVAGYTNSFGGEWDFYLIKTNSFLDTLWTHTYGRGSNDCEKAYSVQQTSDGGYILAGYTQPDCMEYTDVYLVKTNASGNQLWARTYGGDLNDEGASVQQTADGGFIIAGQTNSFGQGRWDVYLVKTNSSGDSLWAHPYGDVGNDYGYSVWQAADSGYLIAGETDSYGAGSSDFYLLKTNTSGFPLEACYYGGGEYDRGYSVQQTADGSHIIAGFTESFGAGMRDFFLVKAVGDMTGVDDDITSCIPVELTFVGNYPNPFNAVTVFRYGLRENSFVSLSVYNLGGQKVATLVDGKQAAGYKSVSWDASDYSSGIYFYKLTAGEFTQTKRMTLLK